MHDVYTTINPSTGEPTREQEFVNSWKWKYSNNNGREESLDISAKDSLTSRYWLDQDTSESIIFKIYELEKDRDKSRNLQRDETRKNTELLESLEIASIEIKDLKQQVRKQNREEKQFKQTIKDYVVHKENCSIQFMKVIGRAKNKTKCSCGLSDLLSKEK